MSNRNKVAFLILNHWGYHNVTVGDLDGRNFAADHKEHSKKSWYRPKDRSYKTSQAVAHAFKLADLAAKVYERQ